MSVLCRVRFANPSGQQPLERALPRWYVHADILHIARTQHTPLRNGASYLCFGDIAARWCATHACTHKKLLMMFHALSRERSTMLYARPISEQARHIIGRIVLVFGVWRRRFCVRGALDMYVQYNLMTFLGWVNVCLSRALRTRVFCLRAACDLLYIWQGYLKRCNTCDGDSVATIWCCCLIWQTNSNIFNTLYNIEHKIKSLLIFNGLIQKCNSSSWPQKWVLQKYLYTS